MKLDLASLASIREFVDAFKAKNLPLHYLINNAAVMAIPERTTTSDGFEAQFGTNHIGHFYLTNLLAPILIKSAPSRVVTVSSIGHRLSECSLSLSLLVLFPLYILKLITFLSIFFYFFRFFFFVLISFLLFFYIILFLHTGPIVFDDLQLEKSYDKWKSYGQSKTANALFALELNNRLKSKGVTSTSLHPGGIMTNLQRDLTHDEMVNRGWISTEGKVHELFKSIEEGTSTHMYAALYPNVDEIGGKYLDNCAVGEPVPHATDLEAATKLWEVSEKLVGQTFSY